MKNWPLVKVLRPRLPGITDGAVSQFLSRRPLDLKSQTLTTTPWETPTLADNLKDLNCKVKLWNGQCASNREYLDTMN